MPTHKSSSSRRDRHDVDPRTDAQLFRAATQGDAFARACLVERHLPMARGLVRRSLGSDHEAEDIAHDAIVAALSSLSSLRDGQAFAKWFGRVVLQTAYKNIRRRASGRRALRAVRPEDVRGSWLPDEEVELRRIVARDPTTAHLLMLHSIEGRTLVEAAHIAGVSLSTVKRRIASARVELAEHPAPRRAAP